MESSASPGALEPCLSSSSSSSPARSSPPPIRSTGLISTPAPSSSAMTRRAGFTNGSSDMSARGLLGSCPLDAARPPSSRTWPAGTQPPAGPSCFASIASSCLTLAEWALLHAWNSARDAHLRCWSSQQVSRVTEGVTVITHQSRQSYVI